MSRTPRTALMAMARRSLGSCVQQSIGTCPRNGKIGNARSEQPSAEALLLRNGHDDLRVGGGLQKVLVAHHRGDDGRLVRVVRLESPQRRDGALETRVDGLQPEASRALEDDGE